MSYSRIIFLFLFPFLFVINSYASHIRAGEIIAKRIGDTRFEFTFFGYRDEEGVPFGQGLFSFGDGNEWGDDSGENIPWNEDLIVRLGNGVERWQFTLSYDYGSSGTFIVSYQEDFRNDGIQNISGSSTTAFYVETKVVLDDLFPNNSPFFTVPPIDFAVVGAEFEHNPGAVDPDGDSLSFFFTTPRQGLDEPVDGYRTLIDPTYYDDFSIGSSMGTEPTLSIDEDGTLKWDAPGGASFMDGLGPLEWNVAFVVEEHRIINGRPQKLGFVTRDMQIIVWNFENDPPEIELPPDTCIIAGNVSSALFTGTDPDGDSVKLEAFGNPFQVNPTATVTPNPAVFQPLPAVLEFEWATDCGLVKAAPYEVVVKATDDPQIQILDLSNPPGQVNFETWRLTIVGPEPTGLTVNRSANRSMTLNWDEYECPNAEAMQIWRRVGEFDFDPGCETGVPANSGYELIETVDILRTSYVDTNNDTGLSPGSNYCYRLVAIFPLPLGGESVASQEACDSLLIDVPVITNVDTKVTSDNNGSIEVKWVPPLQVDESSVPPPFMYELFRSEDGIEGSFTSVYKGSDTLFLDGGLDTENITYTYQVELFDNLGLASGKSQYASAVRSLPIPQVGAIRVNWDAQVPWSIMTQSFPYHYIYRDNINPSDLSELVLVDSVDVTVGGLTYFDDGIVEDELDEEIEYCYFVTTSGSYGNSLLPEPLSNSSQIVCVQPNDTIPPCTPLSISFAEDLSCDDQLFIVPCDVNQFQNVFSWSEDGASGCDNDIAIFNIYFSRTGDEDSYELLDQTTEFTYTHDNLRSLAGCYFITAVDFSGNESQRSEVFCNDNCPKYNLPNVFTPNGDGKNDFFRPFKDNLGCPRFLESVVFTVTNRAGLIVFEYNSNEESDISSLSDDRFLINWDGKSDAGIELPAGTYFYSAELEFDVLNSEESSQVIKGWIQLIR